MNADGGELHLTDKPCRWCGGTGKQVEHRVAVPAPPIRWEFATPWITDEARAEHLASVIRLEALEDE